jgi:hypothetical protein
MDQPYEMKVVNDQDAVEVKSERMQSIADRDNEALARLGKKSVLKVRVANDDDFKPN